MVKHGRQAGRRLVGGPTPGYAVQRPGIYIREMTLSEVILLNYIYRNGFI